MKENIGEILTAIRENKLSNEEAQKLLWEIFYEEGDEYLLDLHREKRIGFPEVILAEGKSSSQLISIAGAFLRNSDRVLISNLDKKQEKDLKAAFIDLFTRREGRLMVIRKTEGIKTDLGTVGLITAGTSDIPFARECGLILLELGADVIEAFDTGAAGMHRPELGIKKVKRADVLIIFAGMEGVLPSLVASLSDLPVIAVPTPIGYGYGGQGLGALSTMLQTCVPGVLVVNIGNAIGAAAGAIRFLRILKRKSISSDTRSVVYSPT
jgi:hypothetical protein